MDTLIISMVSIGVFGLLLAVLGIYMMSTGRGAFLVAGFNTMPKEQKGEYDSKALCKFVGKFLIGLGLVTVLFAVGLTLGVMYSKMLLWITMIAFFVIVTSGSLGMVMYLNTGNRFKR